MHVIETGLTLAAVILLAVLAWSVFVYISPYRECRWCRNRPKGRRCWRCKRTKLTRRLGAKPVHKIALSLRQAWEERR
jgi:hypothetical protein